MSFDAIMDRLLGSIKQELTKEKNRQSIENDILKPLIQLIMDQMYPYMIGTLLFFMAMFLFLIVLLFLNIRLFMTME